MKFKQLFLFAGLAAVALFPSCADDAEMAFSGNESPNASTQGTLVTITAAVDAQDQLSKVAMMQADNSLDLVSKWQSDDQIQVFARQNDEVYNIGKVPVDNISEDGKSCSFNIVLPANIDATASYDLYGFCGIEAGFRDGIISFDASTTRRAVSNFRAPMMFAVSASSTTVTAGFTHFGAYELLHVVNNTSSAISFSNNGFSTDNRWYSDRFRCTLDYSTKKLTTEAIGGGQSNEGITIAAGKMNTIISWYVPNGKSITQAYLEASVNGYGKRSENAKTSSTVITAGKAYHLYATWNGNVLRLGDQITVNAAATVSAADVAAHIKSLPAGEFTITVEGVCGADVISSAMKANTKAIINLDLRNCETTPSFTGVTTLKSVKLPVNATSVSASAFSGCSALESVEMPDGVETINAKAFYGCKALKNINMPSYLKVIDVDAFYGCAGLTRLELPAKLNRIGARAFANCDYINLSVSKANAWKYTTDSKVWTAKAGGKLLPNNLSQTWLVESNMYYYYRGFDYAVKDGEGTKTITINGVDIEFILVKGGTFWMGAQKTDPDAPNYDTLAQDNEAPVHQVTLDDYYIGKYEITRAQWKAVMGGEIEDDDYKYPQGYISWNSCHDYLNLLQELTSLDVKLPTEAQWEFAARSGKSNNTSLYSGTAPWDNLSSGGSLQPIGDSFRRNDLGICDMSGNCWEFVSDRLGTYPSEHTYNPGGPTSGHRILRGGGGGASAADCRVSRRANVNYSRYYDSNCSYGAWDYGFRLTVRP